MYDEIKDLLPDDWDELDFENAVNEIGGEE